MISAFCSSMIAQTLSVSPVTVARNDRKEFCVSINGATDMTALQFNLSLPEGFTVDFIGQSGIKLGEATNDHTLSVKTLENGDLLVVLYNMEFNTFTDGELVRIPFEACEEEGTYQGTLYNVRTATTDAVSHQLEDVVYEAKVIIPVKRVILDKEALTMVVGEAETLVANVRPDDATDKTVTWSTSDASVATVADGVVTALAAGTTTITAKAGDKEATCVVTVEAAAVEPEAKYYWYLGTEKLLTDEEVEVKGIQISDKSEITTLTWESAEYVYFIYPKEFGKAVIIDEGGDEAGGKAVEALSNVNLEKYTGWRFNKDNQGAEYSISFTEPEYTVSLDQTNVTLAVGESVTLTATVIPEGATTESMWWEIYDTNIATVEDGVVTAVSEGSTRIIVHVGDYFAACQVTVEAAAVEPDPEPTVASGEYYLYHADSKRFLSRGEHWGACATVDRYGIPFVWTAEEYSLKFLDSNVHLFETDDSNIYTDNNSTGFTFEAVEGGYLLKSQKSDRYLTIVTAAITHDIVNVTDDASAAVVWQLKSKAEHDAIVAGYVEENYANVIAAAGLTATTGGFVSYLSTLTATDMTSAIGTARFAGSAGDWTFTEVRHQDWQPAYGTDFCELWQATGSYTQTITGLAEGIYKVTVQGFERSGGWAECNALAEKGYEISTATLSANGEETNLKSWYSGKTDSNNPDNTGQAVAKFNEGKYMNEVYTYVGADGTLTLTVCKPSHVGGNWIVFNNFTLTRYAEGGTGVGQLTIDNGQWTIYDLMGRKVENPAKGIYIVGGKKTVVR